MENFVNNHKYFLFCTGTKFKGKTTFNTRALAEDAMKKFCMNNGIQVELTERDKHEAKYSNHKGIRFYINRV